MTLFGALFGDDEAASQLSDRARLQAMLDVEAALADAEAELGIIPRSCATPIRNASRAALYDAAAIAGEAAAAGNLAIPLVQHLTRHVAAADPDAARYVHWGATSQDILDTGLILQLRAAVPAIVGHLLRGERAAARLAREHIATPMAGRTWLQQATPITFGLKAAGWLDALDRERAAIETSLNDASVLQFGGASGTLASLGDRGGAVAARLADLLGLTCPDIPWHAHRDRLVRLACALGIACGVLGKIGRDIALLAQTEVGESAEAHGGGSSTMPHKQNPVKASVALAASVRAPGLVATMLAAMPQEHERGLGGWQAEWVVLPELVLVTAGASRALADALTTLRVYPERMRANLDATRGLALAEAVAMTLAGAMGKRRAHARVEEASRRAAAEGLLLADALAADPEVARHMTRDEIDRRLDPASYLGEARTFVERVLARVSGVVDGR
ncbi:MAG TPA: 3-carboxy-cis,cis-muconate cycloisomerase [Vicinamibacterales bacterium]